MTAFENLYGRITELKELERQRKEDKAAAFAKDFGATEVTVTTLDGAEIVIADELVFYESYYGTSHAPDRERTARYSHGRPDGRAALNYAPGRRWALYVEESKDYNGTTVFPVHTVETNNLDELARFIISYPGREALRQFKSEMVLASAEDTKEIGTRLIRLGYVEPKA